MVLTVFLPYVMQKINDMITRNNWIDPRKRRTGTFGDKIKYFFARVIGFFNSLYKLSSLINLLLFFVTHAMRSLPERLLGITL